MAIGTTADFNLDRDGIITIAYRKIGLTTNATLTSRAADLLNIIVREQDLMDVAQAKDLWALNETTLQLSADGFVYTTADGLDSSILDIVTVYYRNTDGDDAPVTILDQQQYEQIIDKDEKGDVQKIYLKKARLLSDQILYIWPAPDTVGTTTVITGTDALNYSCIMGHTSIADNRPITGANWRLYWRQTGTGGVAWATGTAYTNGELLRCIYKRPIYDFDLSTDNPDFPSGWNRYFIYRLATDLAEENEIDMDTRRWLQTRYIEAREAIFGSTRSNSTDIRNKAVYY